MHFTGIKALTTVIQASAKFADLLERKDIKPPNKVKLPHRLIINLKREGLIRGKQQLNTEKLKKEGLATEGTTSNVVGLSSARHLIMKPVFATENAILTK
jgi:hypothetical protein